MNNRDSGLQPERTELSWQRTAWSMLILSLLCLRGWLNNGDWLYCLCSGLLLTGGGVAIFAKPGRSKPALISLIIIFCGCLLILINVKKYLLMLG
ncbi:DUF202 domain-containing protein [Citrobacter sp. JGM124]|uniref:DUF202 domain-containing protein n=1 Tax=Citrobacter sp. JGM124 TaxID=2799789 RepID=UPI001BAD88D4|nr:DUF202 domain-containing protein [Citrobacter sp. JGM124]MBS0849397.1 DUF202 domain-containing protein [Citrobacter sp. JGM124]